MLLNCGVGEDSWESLGLQGDTTSPSERSILSVHWKDWYWSWNSNNMPPDAKNWLIWKDSDAGKDWMWEEKGRTEDEMAGWHHRLDGRESKWTPGVGDGQGGLACWSPWGDKESGTTEQLSWLKEIKVHYFSHISLYGISKQNWLGIRKQGTELYWSSLSQGGTAVSNMKLYLCFLFLGVIF